MLYACDSSWWDVHIERVRESFHGELWTQYNGGSKDTGPAIEKYGLNCVESFAGHQFRHQPGQVGQGENSGFQALNLAWHFGARRVYLLGYDMGMGRTGQRHFFGDHPPPLGNADEGQYRKLANFFANCQWPMDIINCSRRTALDCFERQQLETVLDNYEKAAEQVRLVSETVLGLA